jgi:molybdate transport system ATP-binding protein
VSLSFSAQLAARGFDADLEIRSGERVAVLGRNGSGKSTLLHILAGTLRPDGGTATLDGNLLFDLRGGRRRWLAPSDRGIAMLAQDALLFPHLSVIENVAFGPRAAGLSRAKAHARAERWLDEVSVADLAGRRPGQLSGGQAQRVAVARALASEPKLLLLDEPMAALDVSVAPLLRRVLGRVLAGRTTVLVTHDLLDALLLSDRIIVLDGGRVAEFGATEEVMRHPRTRFTAAMVGLNLIRGVIDDGCVREAGGLRIEGVDQDGQELHEGDPAAAVFSPTGVAIHSTPPGGSPRNNLPVTIAVLEPIGHLIRVRADDHRGHVIAADVTPRSVADLDLYPGRQVTYSVKAAAVTIYPL